MKNIRCTLCYTLTCGDDLARYIYQDICYRGEEKINTIQNVPL
jgi:hypothetical protein